MLARFQNAAKGSSAITLPQTFYSSASQRPEEGKNTTSDRYHGNASFQPSVLQRFLSRFFCLLQSPLVAEETESRQVNHFLGFSRLMKGVQ